MLIEALFNWVYLLFYAVTMVFEIPEMPVKVVEIVGQLIEYVSTGIAILGNYCDMAYLTMLFSLIAILDLTVWLIKGILWLLRKIPLLGIN